VTDPTPLAAGELEPAGTLAQLERVIERGLETFIEVGEALCRIRDERLYREAGFRSFEAYCQERWGHRRAWADRQITAMRKVTELDPTGSTPANEWQARQLPEPGPDEVEALVARIAADYPHWTEERCRGYAADVLKGRELVTQLREDYRRGMQIRAELQAALDLGEVPPEGLAEVRDTLEELDEWLTWERDQRAQVEVGEQA
jgi:hypothetical protein